MSRDGADLAQVVDAAWRRALGDRKIQRSGDEQELVEFVLGAWNRTDADQEMELEVLGVLMSGFLVPLVLVEIADHSDDPDFDFLREWDTAAMTDVLRESGVAAWCRANGFPLRTPSGEVIADGQESTPLSVLSALELVRERRDAPTATDELVVIRGLDDAVSKALPLCRALVGEPGSEEATGSATLGASLRLLFACRLAGAVVVPSLAHSSSDLAPDEDWLAYLVNAIRVGLALWLSAESRPTHGRTLLLEEEDVDLLAEDLRRRQ